MATTRTRLRRHRVGGDAEYQAWSDAFMTGYDFFGALQEFGVIDPTGQIVPVEEKPAARARFRNAAADAWRRFGSRFMAEWEPTDTHALPWAAEQFGEQ